MIPVKEQHKVPLPVPFYYGWVIVFMGAMGMFFSGPGQTFSISVFIDSYILEFGWSRSLISSIYLFATLLAGFLMFFVGRLVDKYGQRYITIGIAFMLGIACLFNSLVMGPVMLFIGFSMLRLFGQGGMTLLPGTLVPQWFMIKRGRALSFMAIGIFLGSAAIPPFNAWIISAWGWPAAWRVWAVLLFFFFIPLALLLIRNKPEDVGLLPDGVTETERLKSTKAVDDKETQRSEEVSWTLQEAKQTRAFWLILGCVAIPAMVNTGIVFHLISILGERGISTTHSAFILSLMAIVAFPVTLIAGYVVDRIKVHYILGCAFIGQILAMILLLQADSLALAIGFGIARGIVGGFEAISIGIIFPNYFGRESLGSIKGISMTVTVIGSAFGPLPFAIFYDRFGGYTEIIWIMMLFPLIGSLAAFLSPAPKNKMQVDSHP